MFEETPLTQGGPGLPGALRSLIGAHPELPSLAREPTPAGVSTPPAESLPSAEAAPVSPGIGPVADSAAPTSAQLFERAALAHSRRLLAIARAVVGNRASPEDVVQQALVNLYQHRDRYDWNQPGGLLRRAVVNEALRIVRQPKLAPAVPDLPGRCDAPGDGMIDRETVERVRSAIDRLPEHFRAALVLCEYEGMAYVQIAEVLGASVPQVKTWLHRGRRQLARMLKDYVDAAPPSQRHSE